MLTRSVVGLSYEIHFDVEKVMTNLIRYTKIFSFVDNVPFPKAMCCPRMCLCTLFHFARMGKHESGSSVLGLYFSGIPLRLCGLK